MQKKIFISYSDSDRTKMRLLEKTINNFSDWLTPIIIADNREALAQLTKKVSKGITECDFLIPIITRNSISTQWINQEIGFGTALNKVIIPIVEKDLLNDLKGFVHKQLDLSYLYESYSVHPPTESKRFKASTILLINDLMNNLNLNNNLIDTQDYKINPHKIINKNQMLIKSDEIVNAIPNFNKTIDNEILASESGTISIWAYVNDLHNKIQLNRNFKYILSFATNNGKRLNNPSLAKYPNAWSICRVTPTDSNHFGSWRFWCNNIEKEKVEIKYDKLISSGWHLFTISWSKKDNYIMFLIDKDLVGKSEFKNWPSDLSGSFHLGTWSNNSSFHYFDSMIGPYKFIYESYNENLINEMLMNKPK